MGLGAAAAGAAKGALQAPVSSAGSANRHDSSRGEATVWA